MKCAVKLKSSRVSHWREDELRLYKITVEVIFASLVEHSHERVTVFSDSSDTLEQINQFNHKYPPMTVFLNQC